MTQTERAAWFVYGLEHMLHVRSSTCTLSNSEITDAQNQTRDSAPNIETYGAHEVAF